MLQGWNSIFSFPFSWKSRSKVDTHCAEFCFRGGRMEARMSLPGDVSVHLDNIVRTPSDVPIRTTSLVSGRKLSCFH